MSFAEVEETVAAMPGVYECAARRRRPCGSGRGARLFIVPDRGAKIDVEDVRRHLPAHWDLDSIRLVSELPMTSTGKIARSRSRFMQEGFHAITLDDKINRLLAIPPYSQAPRGKTSESVGIAQGRDWITLASATAGYENYVSGWPLDYRSAGQVASLPFCLWEFSRPIPRYRLSAGRDQTNLDLERDDVSTCPAASCSIRRPHDA